MLSFVLDDPNPGILLHRFNLFCSLDITPSRPGNSAPLGDGWGECCDGPGTTTDAGPGVVLPDADEEPVVAGDW